jgi:hypothetical protein
MSNGETISGLPMQSVNSSKTTINRVTIALQTALLRARPEHFRSGGMFEIVHAVQKATRDC